MHEMALAESVRRIVEDTAARHGARRVTRVRLAIGKLSQVEVEAMRFAFEVVKRGSCFEQAALAVDETDADAWCLACAEAVTITRRGDPCPRCGSHQLQVDGGDDLRVVDIEIE